jgi:hypothetical protein
MQTDGYDIDIPVQGFPGKPACHGGITAWFDDDIEATTLFELEATVPPAARRAAGSR